MGGCNCGKKQDKTLAGTTLRQSASMKSSSGIYDTASAPGCTEPYHGAFRSAYINDAWLVRRLPTLVAEAGFADADLRGHSYVQTADVDYMLSVATRGADAIAAAGRIGPALAAASRPRQHGESPPARSSATSPTPA